MDLTASGPKNLQGSGAGTSGDPFIQTISDPVVRAAVGSIADASWSGVGSGSVIALLKAIYEGLAAAAHPVTPDNGTITAGGSAQTLFGGTTPPFGYLVQNTSDEDQWVSDFGTASADGSSILLGPGQMFQTPPGYKPPGAVSLFGATTGKSFVGRMW